MPECRSFSVQTQISHSLQYGLICFRVSFTLKVEYHILLFLYVSLCGVGGHCIGEERGATGNNFSAVPRFYEDKNRQERTFSSGAYLSKV